MPRPRPGPNPIDGFALTSEDFGYIGNDLRRPESVLALRDGTIWCSDSRGGATKIAASGEQTLVLQQPAEHFHGSAPNGLALDRSGAVVIANFGTDRVETMSPSGTSSVLFDAVGGEWPGKVNFVLCDSRDRLWITISTMQRTSPPSLRPDVEDGRILLYERGSGVRVVAEGIRFSNECRLDATEEWLYVAQTTGRNVVRLRVGPDGSLGPPEVFGPPDHGRFIDGLAFDAYGNLWGTYVMADGIFALTPEGELRMIFDDSTSDEVEALDQAFRRSELTVERQVASGGRVARWTSSLAFGGEDLRTVYVGSVRQRAIAYFRSPAPGMPLPHWRERDDGGSRS